MNGLRKKNNGYEYRFTHCGKRYSVSGTTIRECKAKAEQRILEASRGLKTDADKVTWAEYTSEWLNAKSVSLKESTIHSYRKKLLMLSSLDKKRMQDIDRRDILALQSSLAKKYTSASVNWLITMVRHILDSAVADEIITKNPAKMVKALKRTEPKATETIHRALTMDEQTAFLEYARSRNAWYLELYELMLVTGMRIGEAGALTWADIDDGIRIDKTISQVGTNKYAVQSTKTDAGNRTLPLTPSAKDILIRQRIKVAEFKGVSFTASDMRVFYGVMDDSCVNPSKVDSAIALICEKTGLPRFTSHAFRDTYATRCIQQGMQPNTLKKLMGHTKIAITMDLYAQVQPEDMSVAMSKVNIL